MKGFVTQLFTLVALVVGVYCAYTLSHLVARFISSTLSTDPTFTNIVAFLITFIGVWALIYLVGKVAHQIVQVAMLSLVNRIAGAAFSLLKTVFIISILLIVFETLNESLNIVSEETLSKSLLYKPIKSVGSAIFPYISFNL